MPHPDTQDGRSSGRSRRRRWTFRLLAVGVAACGAAGAILWFLLATERLVYDAGRRRYRLQPAPIYLAEPGFERTGHRYLYDPTLGWKNIPNWRATTNGRPLSINSRGLRDREHAYAKPEGVQRILVLGDSYAWGYGVGDAEIFTEVLERRLGPAVEVINAGVSGWGTDQELLFLTSEGLRYEPDIVVLALYLLNDLENNCDIEQYGLYKPMFANLELELANVPVPRPGARRPAAPAPPDGAALTAAIAGRMSQACAARGCQFVVMKFGRFLYPQSLGWRDLERQLRRRLAAQIESLRYLDVDAALEEREISTDSILEGNDDGHWNAAGHAAAAAILLDYLNAEQLLARP